MIMLGQTHSLDSDFLNTTLDTEEGRIALGEAVGRFLRTHIPDGGAESDHIYVIGMILANENVWRRLDPSYFAYRIKDVSNQALDLFFETVPDYRDHIKRIINDLR